VVSPDYTLNPKLLATLFGPTQCLRSTLRDLELCGNGLDSAVLFILEAIESFEYVLDEEDFDEEAYDEQEEEKSTYWELQSSATSSIVEPEWLWDDNSHNLKEQALISTALVNFDSFCRLTMDGIRIEEFEHGRHTLQNLYFFSNLVSLVLTIPSHHEIYLIFTQPRFYQLSFVCLKGTYREWQHLPTYALLWRWAITK